MDSVAIIPRIRKKVPVNWLRDPYKVHLCQYGSPFSHKRHAGDMGIRALHHLPQPGSTILSKKESLALSIKFSQNVFCTPSFNASTRQILPDDPARFAAFCTGQGSYSIPGAGIRRDSLQQHSRSLVDRLCIFLNIIEVPARYSAWTVRCEWNNIALIKFFDDIHTPIDPEGPTVEREIVVLGVPPFHIRVEPVIDRPALVLIPNPLLRRLLPLTIT